jgi:uncharacterized protein YbbC (DUF1343 family)
MDNLFLAFFLSFSLLMNVSSCHSMDKQTDSAKDNISQTTTSPILPGAYQTGEYLPYLKNKNVALVVNQTSQINNTHLADTLLSLGVKIKKIFAPEHGFRGEADAGETVKNDVDKKTGLPLVSLYGNNKKPTSEQLKDVDVIIFDIQDVGARFYTYISTMHYLMEACAENNKTLLILDRPNPNGSYIDGPILEPKYKSFVGMHPIPIVHGLTVAELAQMINGEHWLDSNRTCNLKIVKVKNYEHKDRYVLPVKPSPNLPNELSIMLYPSLGLFEGTVMSVGRGTDKAFQVIGAPDTAYGKDTFKPVSTPGAKNPPYENKVCYGVDLTKLYPEPGLKLKYVIDMYKKAPDKGKYFNNFFNKLAGNSSLQEQIKKGMSETAIRESWQPNLDKYKLMRKNYLLYKDF